MTRKSQRLVPWFGSDTENAAEFGAALDGCKWVGVPFGGGMSEVPFVTAKTIVVSDLHRHIINLCAVIANDELRARLVKAADEMPYHPDILRLAQEQAVAVGEHFALPHYDAALAYFVAVWMNRGGEAGTASELNGKLPVRWNANGGGSNRRYRTAIEALDAWGAAFRRCEFVCMDAFAFLDKCHDEPDNGIYVDAPWPDAGAGYLHSFDEDDQRRLASRLDLFTRARVVIRFGAHPLIEEIYPVDKWTWRPMKSRNQANEVKAEWMIGRNLANGGP